MPSRNGGVRPWQLVRPPTDDEAKPHGSTARSLLYPPPTLLLPSHPPPRTTNRSSAGREQRGRRTASARRDPPARPPRARAHARARRGGVRRTRGHGRAPAAGDCTWGRPSGLWRGGDVGHGPPKGVRQRGDAGAERPRLESRCRGRMPAYPSRRSRQRAPTRDATAETAGTRGRARAAPDWGVFGASGEGASVGACRAPRMRGGLPAKWRYFQVSGPSPRAEYTWRWMAAPT